MTTPRDRDEILADWLDEGPTRLPDQTRRAINVALPTTTQRRRGWTVPWKGLSMSTASKVAVGAVAVLAIVLGGTVLTGSGMPIHGIGGAPTSIPTNAASPTMPPASSSIEPSTRPIAWEPFTSVRYGFTGAYPDDWTVRPTERDWTYETDAIDWLSPAHEAFVAPDSDVRVSVWSIPYDSGTTADTLDFEAWIEAYCQKTAGSSCTGIRERAVPLCIERRDCHPGLLVPFDEDVQAFLTGGIFGDKMTVVAVWRKESDPTVAKYGGSRQLLEAFLSTMDVWPASVPLEQRVIRDAPVTLR